MKENSYLMTIADRARRRFDSLRSRALASVEFDPDSTAPPSGWCVSAIARLRANAPGAIPKVESIQQALAPVAELYLYPPDSLHVSLLGCTQREEEPQTSTPTRVRGIHQVVGPVVSKYSPVTMKLGRVNLLGTQFFIEVVTGQEDWSRIRVELETNLKEIGEHPIAYADTEPIHLNVARMLSAPDASVLRKILSAADLNVDEDVLIDTVELVLTDFVVSPDKLKALETYSIGRPS